MRKQHRDRWVNSIKAIRFIQDEGERIGTKKLGKHLIYRYQDEPVPVLEIMVNSNGRAKITLKLNPDGTIVLKGDRKTADSRRPTQWDTETFNRMMRETEEAILDAAERTLGRGIVRDALIQWNQYNNGTKILRETALQAVHASTGNAEHRGERIQNEYERASRKLGDLLRSKFFRRETEDEMEGCFKNRDTDHTSKYNWTRLNQKTLRQMAMGSPHVISYYCNFLLDTKNRSKCNRKVTRERITREVRNDLSLTKAQWKLFTRIGAVVDPETTKSAMKAVSEANRPKVPDKILAGAAWQYNKHTLFAEAQSRQGENRWRHGDPWRAWIHLLQTYLGNAERNPKEFTHQDSPGFMELTRAGDALAWHVGNQQPWRLTDLDSYRRRTQRWHQEIQREENQERARSLLETNWDSMVREVTVLKKRVKAVTNGMELANLGREMHNCLGSFVSACEQGQARIFVVKNSQGTVEAALEIQRHKDRWRTGQVETQRGKPGKEVHRQIATRVRNMYQQAQDGRVPEETGEGEAI